MSQVSWRAPDALIDRVRRVAAASDLSMNEYLTRVMDAATDPDTAGDENTAVRERLARAGLLAPAGETRRRPNARAVAAARKRAGRGAGVAKLIRETRR